jgi:signal transduction histidine kinase
VLVNLLNNAFDAVRDRRRKDPSFRDGVVTVRTSRGDQWIEVCVTDNGVGVPAAIRDRIFEPFFTTKSGKEGTGLGLSLCYEIMVQGHRGRLAVESTPGEGTTFVASLPASKAQADGGETVSESQ